MHDTLEELLSELETAHSNKIRTTVELIQEESYRAGYNNGQEDGYRQGYRDGDVKDGDVKGYADGYRKGYADGLNYANAHSALRSA